MCGLNPVKIRIAKLKRFSNHPLHFLIAGFIVDRGN